MNTAGAGLAWPSGASPDLLDASLAANPGYELIMLDDLDDSDRVALAGLDGDPALHAVLRPTSPSLTVKAVCRSTAALIDAHRVECKFARARYPEADEELRRIIAQLIVDSVLLIRTEQGLATGAEAAHLVTRRPDIPECADTQARLSLDALRYAQALEVRTPAELSAALYFYNRVPASPAWCQLISSPARAWSYLGMAPGGALCREVAQAWRHVPSAPDNSGWAFFKAHQRPQRPARHKLYLSPLPDELPRALTAAVPVLARHSVPGFKLGADVHGILRPDKFVVYLQSAEEADSLTADLADCLAGIPAHGVPFTAGALGGLLSWGVDPPRSESLLPWHGTSWRRWLTDRLASYLYQARGAGSMGTAAVRIALDRLELEGVNTATWTPDRLPWADQRTVR